MLPCARPSTLQTLVKTDLERSVPDILPSARGSIRIPRSAQASSATNGGQPLLEHDIDRDAFVRQAVQIGL